MRETAMIDDDDPRRSTRRDGYNYIMREMFYKTIERRRIMFRAHPA